MDSQLEKIISDSSSVVFFGGAGVSTESGIPDFRSPDGLYNQKYDYPPEVMLSHSFYVRYPEKFFDFYRDKMIPHGVKPNKAHIALAGLEKSGKLKAVITQNIDGLHQAAGSVNVLELHGSIHRNYCTRCGKFYPLEYIDKSHGVPKCTCGGTVKPDVVLYEEGLNGETISKSIEFVSRADTLIIGGTSLAVYPAASLIDYFEGRHLVLINKTPTPADSKAELIIRKPIGEALGNN